MPIHRPSLSLLLLFLAAGCDPRTPVAPEPVLHLQPAGGDEQRAPIGSLLPVPLEVEVVDDQGQPVAGIVVTWRAVHNGTIEHADPLTDVTGRARAVFRLGDVPGRATASAAVGSLAPVLFHHTVDAADSEVLRDRLTAITFPTYEGSGEVVHPDVVWAPDLASPLLLAITPYPNGDNRYENPSLFGGRFGREWIVPAGVVNPLVRPGPAGIHLSDPDLVRRQETGELFLYYREVADRNLILLIRSMDGRSWTAPELVVAAPNHQVISPAVVQRGPGDWRMWSVNGFGAGCGGATATLEMRRSADGVAWGPPETQAIAPPGFWPWHVEVQWIAERNEYWALYNAKTPGSCATGVLFLATSPDGVQWITHPRPVLRQGDLPAFDHIVYRSTFRYLPATDEIIFWFTGARHASGRWQWGAAVDRRTRDGSFKTSAAFPDPRDIKAPPAPLDDWP